jgi:F-type H+-transporting ATPase subunit epsilon
MPIKVEIVTPHRLLASDEVDMVTLPGVEGQMGVMRGHAPLLSTLDIGEIILHKGNQVQYVAVGGGVVEVRPDKVTVLAEVAEHAEEIDVGAAVAGGESPTRAQTCDRSGLPAQHLAAEGGAAPPSPPRAEFRRREIGAPRPNGASARGIDPM